MRLFLAVPLPAATRAAIDAALAPVRARLEGAPIAWEPATKLHVTLRFLGEVDSTRLEALTAIAADVAARHAPFPLSLAGLSAFPVPVAPEVLWVAAVDGADRLGGLARALDEALAAAGVHDPTRDARPYVAHVTCARARSAAGARALATVLAGSPAVGPFTTEVDRVTLFESRGGAYHPLVEEALGR